MEKKVVRNADIIARAAHGEPYAAIAASHSISVTRVGQVVKAATAVPALADPRLAVALAKMAGHIRAISVIATAVLTGSLPVEGRELSMLGEEVLVHEGEVAADDSETRVA